MAMNENEFSINNDEEAFQIDEIGKRIIIVLSRFPCLMYYFCKYTILYLPNNNDNNIDIIYHK